MSITRNDILNKVFTRAMLGYEETEVDVFLDEIMSEVDELNQQSHLLLLEKESLKAQLQQATEKANQSMVTRQELGRLKDENQKLREEIASLREAIDDGYANQHERIEAEKEAQTILADAERKAKEIMRNADLHLLTKTEQAEKEAAAIVKKAREAAEETARDVQERERQIIDRAQLRARKTIETANAKASETLLKPELTGQANIPSVMPDEINAESEDDWPVGWLDAN